MCLDSITAHPAPAGSHVSVLYHLTLNILYQFPLSVAPLPPPESRAVPQNLRGFRGSAGGPAESTGRFGRRGGKTGAGGTVYWEA